MELHTSRIARKIPLAAASASSPAIARMKGMSWARDQRRAGRGPAESSCRVFLRQTRRALSDIKADVLWRLNEQGRAEREGAGSAAAAGEVAH